MRSIKHHHVYKEYGEAIRLARMLLRGYDYGIIRIGNVPSEECPVFWIDMALLYEHYVLGLLLEAYPEKIRYQAKGKTGCPDFVYGDSDGHTVILDTKYSPKLKDKDSPISSDIVRQLSGYSRDRKIITERPSGNVPCVVIYPTQTEDLDRKAENPFDKKPLMEFLTEENEDQIAWNFYRIAVPLPTIPGT